MNAPQTRSFGSAMRRGTTLVEVLVVMVILLVGILAVVQIFPRGFQILTLAKKNSQATQLSRDEAERLKSRTDGIPEQILGDALPSQLSLHPECTIDSGGIVYNASSVPQGNWASNVAANHRRRILGEAHRVPAPRRLTNGTFGGLLIPTFGPIDPAADYIVNSSDLAKNSNPPQDLALISGRLYRSGFTYSPFEYFVQDPSNPTVALYLPTGPITLFRVSFYALIQTASGVEKRYFRNFEVPIALTPPDAASGNQPFHRVELNADLVAPVLAVGESFIALNPDSLKVARAMRNVSVFSDNPFEYIPVDDTLGTILVNPLTNGLTVPTTNGRQPVGVVLDYTVRDWRMLRSDFRITNIEQGQFRLPLAPIKVTGQNGPDGLRLTSMGGTDDPILEGQTDQTSFLTIVDLETGSYVCEHRPGTKADITVTVNKSLGLINFLDTNATRDNIQIFLIDPVSGANREVDIEGRAFRAVYMAKEEWAVQVIKPASQYFASPILPAAGEFYIGGSSSNLGGSTTRIYFPAEDVEQKVTISEIHYLDGGGNRRTLSGKDFVIRNDAGNVIPRPYIDIRDADSAAVTFAYDAAPAVRGVKGGSISVRTLWNPDSFGLSASSPDNVRALERFVRGYRRTTVQTFIERGEVQN